MLKTVQFPQGIHILGPQAASAPGTEIGSRVRHDALEDYLAEMQAEMSAYTDPAAPYEFGRSLPVNSAV
ncbi:MULTISPECIES: hypothetical protein [Rhizobium]|uniref:Uncharacterized protein n=1 Tax=Rhizobium rhododendri TaxID=2506430 RepID=A0ABY8IKY1_9HYPH|nr:MULTISPECIES: hypothetical protein [Rhizobium]MBZ5760202.1 hypothetical protein [Rhizobium sp. VS19-DR96]MBZ5766317.1 hypothetical protein [Rhizobium sp. VS19-DR129.2]MBZ5774340.1 hypothetical protein [Rhizobium sp. VS19-DRK62.2]MBZ5785413.1 hypothetical protein [Rhizobium sp. VS19-DR121]MBZ5803011.1 hypothetical protein [Rhizobium sp. VS19-DR181]